MFYVAYKPLPCPDPETTPVGSICSQELTTCRPTRIDIVLKLMREKALRRVLVVNYEKEPIVVVSLGDLALALDRHSVLADISAAPPNR